MEENRFQDRSVTDELGFNRGVTDELEFNDRIFLEKLRFATDIILRLGEDPEMLPGPLESELFLFRDRVDRAILLIPGGPGPMARK